MLTLLLACAADPEVKEEPRGDDTAPPNGHSTEDSGTAVTNGVAEADPA